MRSIWFALMNTSVPDVEGELRHHGFVHAGRAGVLQYPSAYEPTLYITCSGYQWVEEYDLQEEYAELLQATGGREPSVHVGVDVSGRVPGDAEVRKLAGILLRKFDGFAFDDFLSYAHAWNLSEIESDATFNGLRFFDYRGHWKRAQESSHHGDV